MKQINIVHVVSVASKFKLHVLDRSCRQKAHTKTAGVRIVAINLACFLGTLVAVSAARAIPSRTEHPHVNPGITDYDTTWLDNPGEIVPDPDPDVPDIFNHQHRDPDSLYGPNGKYIGYSAWDNNEYRYNPGSPPLVPSQAEAPPDYIWGHGYQALPALYQFSDNFPAVGKTDFNNCVNKWEGLVNANEYNTNNVPITIKINFDPGGTDIDVNWANIPNDERAIAHWLPESTTFEFDPDPLFNVVPDPGQTLVGLTATGPFEPSIDTESANGWYFGGSGTVGSAFQIWQKDAAGNITGPYNIEQYDFYTNALHELGHAWGLAHFGEGIMREDISAFTMRDPDGGSIDGLKDLYAIPTVVPEPSSLAMWLLAIVVLMLNGRR